jgi:hypothetical protein
MKSNNYPARSQLESFADEAGVELAFCEQLYIEPAKGRPWKLLKTVPMLAPPLFDVSVKERW